jgi:hypothetical protein
MINTISSRGGPVEEVQEEAAARAAGRGTGSEKMREMPVLVAGMGFGIGVLWVVLPVEGG